MTVKLLTEHRLEFLSLKGGYTGSSESTLVKIQHCLKSHVAAEIWMSIQAQTKMYTSSSAGYVGFGVYQRHMCICDKY